MFIKLTYKDRAFFINVQSISYMEGIDKETNIYLDRQYCLTVNESIDTILAMVPLPLGVIK